MTYVERQYGGNAKLEEGMGKARRERAIGDEKNRIVYAACIYRKRWSDIESFKDYRYNPKNGAWVITINATPGFHRRFFKLVTDAKTRERFLKHVDKWEKRYHRMAKKNKTVKEDGTED